MPTKNPKPQPSPQSQPRIFTEAITWYRILPDGHLPDDATTVLLAFDPDTSSEPTWPGYLDAGIWYNAGGSTCDPLPLAWTHMPAGLAAPSRP